MFNKFLKHYFTAFAACTGVSLFFGSWLIFQYISFGWFLVLLLFFTIVAYVAFGYYQEDANQEAGKKAGDLEVKIEELQAKSERLDLGKRTFEQSAEIYKQSLLEKSTGFPTLNEIIQAYEEVRDGYLANYLRTKNHPAHTAAEHVKEQSARRRQAELESKKNKLLIEYYEQIAPFLLDFKDEVVEDEGTSFADFTEEEMEDPVVNFLTKEEYRKLTPSERNQMALDRFWKRPKSKWLIGRIYERYVGYIYESKGYDVEYTGIFKGLEDLGRDLLCKKGKELIVIQCKNWSQFRTIYEKHIFQFFGTVFQFRRANKGLNVKGMFYTSTKLSDLARNFAWTGSIHRGQFLFVVIFKILHWC